MVQWNELFENREEGEIDMPMIDREKRRLLKSRREAKRKREKVSLLIYVSQGFFDDAVEKFADALEYDEMLADITEGGSYEINERKAVKWILEQFAYMTVVDNDILKEVVRDNILELYRDGVISI